MHQSKWKYVSENKSIIFADDPSYTVYNVDAITRESASNYLYEIDGRGMQAGSFTTNLIHACMSADMSNLAKLSVVFPEFTQVAMLINRGGENGYLWVRERAHGAASTS